MKKIISFILSLFFVFSLFTGCASVDSSNNEGDEPEEAVKQIVIDQSTEKNEVETELTDKSEVETAEIVTFEKSEVEIPEEEPVEPEPEEKREPDWYTGYRKFNIKEGNLRIKIVPRKGVFNLQAVNENGKSVPVTSTADEYHTTSLYLKVDGDVYKLNENTSVKYAARHVENGVQIRYKVPQVAEVILEYLFEKSDEAGEIDTLRVASYVTSLAKSEHDMTLKLVLDTVLGETDTYHFYDSKLKPLEKDFVTRNFAENPWFLSKNSKAEFQVILNGFDCTTPAVAALASYTELGNRTWEPAVTGIGSFASVMNYSNSAMSIIWQTKKLKPEESFNEVCYFSFGVDGNSAGGNKYVENAEKAYKGYGSTGPDSIPSIEKISAAKEVIDASDGSEKNNSSTIAKETIAAENEAGKENKSSLGETEKSGEVIGSVAEPEKITGPKNNEDSARVITQNQLTNEYIQNLLDRIQALEDSGASINREELLMLNAELDAILEYIRNR